MSGADGHVGSSPARWRGPEDGGVDLAALLTEARTAARDAYRTSAALVRMLDTIGQAGTPEELVVRALEALSDVFSADLVLWARTSGTEIDVVAACGFGDAVEAALPELPGAERFFLGRTPQLWSCPPELAPPVVAGVPVRTAAHVPVHLQEAHGAALVLLLSDESGFGVADLPMLQSIAARLWSSLEDRERQLAVERLAVSGPRLARHLHRQPLLEAAVHTLGEVTGARWTSAVTVEDGLAHLTALGEWPAEGNGLWPRPVEELRAWPLALDGRVYVVHDLVAGPEAMPGHLRGQGRSLMCAPVRVDGEPVALLYAVHPRPAVFTPAAVEAALLLAGYVSAATVNARLYQALSASESRLRVLTDSISDMVAVVDPAGRVGWASPSYTRGLGLDATRLVGSDWTDWVHPDDRPAVRAALARSPELAAEVTTVEHRLRGGTGGWAWVETGLALSPGDAGSVVLSSRFVGDRRRLERELRVQATHDSLTGLANRSLARQVLQDELGAGTAGPVGVLFCDLDEFKAVNDRLGHEAGDDLLRQVADRLRRCVRPHDLLARLGGDEFVVVLPEVDGGEALAAVGHRILAALRRPFVLGRETVRIGGSIGGVLGERRGPAGVSDLLRDADAAMYEAKRAGRGRVRVFDDAAAQRAVERLSLRQEVDGALDHGELSVRYQPVVDLLDGSIEGFEALLRWHHPVHGEIPPEVFVPLAEETGAIGAIGDWVVDEACRELGRWRRLAGGERLTVAVNLSAPQLDDPDLVERVLAALARYDVPPAHLDLEVTESLEKTPAQLERLHRLSEAGIGVVVDDFGVSYANLAHLQDIPADRLKIDQSFVAGLGAPTAPGRRPGIEEGIVRAVLALAEAAGLGVIAEGVETPEQRDRLLSLGCRVAQGFLYAPAVTPEEATRLLVLGGSITPVARSV